MDKYIVAHKTTEYSNKLFLNACSNVEESHKQNFGQKKADPKEYILYGPIYINSKTTKVIYHVRSQNSSCPSEGSNSDWIGKCGFIS